MVNTESQAPLPGKLHDLGAQQVWAHRTAPNLTLVTLPSTFGETEAQEEEG